MSEQGQNSFPVVFAGAGPGDPDLLTVKALRALEAADVVIHDRLVPAAILGLIPEATPRLDVGKAGFGPSTPQDDINALIVEQALAGRRVLRLKGGDPALFARLDEEIAACDAAGLAFEVIPGITAASAAAAAIGQSLTRRDRNGAIRLLTAHDMKGFADHDWSALARPGEVAAIYMGKRAARFVQGRLLMHGADPRTPVAVVENASLPDQRILSATLSTLPADIAAAGLTGPALMLYGLAPHQAALRLPNLQKETA